MSYENDTRGPKDSATTGRIAMPVPPGGGSEPPRDAPRHAAKVTPRITPRKSGLGRQLVITGAVVLGVLVFGLLLGIGIGKGVYTIPGVTPPAASQPGKVTTTPTFDEGADVDVDGTPPTTAPSGLMDGTHEVGQGGMKAGIWESSGAISEDRECRWKATDSTGVQIAGGINAEVGDPETARLSGKVRMFETSGCGPWTKP